MKPTERTLKYLRDRSYHADMVERWIRNPKHPAGGFRRDYFGFGDILAFDEVETLLVQSCGQAFSQHRKDMLENEMVLRWINDHRRALLIGWRKVLKTRGGKQRIWKPRVAEFFDRKNELMCIENKGD